MINVWFSTELRLDLVVKMFSFLSLYQVFSHIASEEFSSLYGTSKFQPAFNLRKLTFSEGQVNENGFKAALNSCPFVDTVVIKRADIFPFILQDMMTISTITSLHIGRVVQNNCVKRRLH